MVSWIIQYKISHIPWNTWFSILEAFYDTLYAGTVLKSGVHKRVGTMHSQPKRPLSNASLLSLLYSMLALWCWVSCRNQLAKFIFLFSLYRAQARISVGSTSTPLPNTHMNTTHTSVHSKHGHSPSSIYSSSSSSSQHSITDSPCSREKSWITAELSDKSTFEPKNLLSLFDEATTESKPWVVNAALLSL